MIHLFFSISIASLTVRTIGYAAYTALHKTPAMSAGSPVCAQLGIVSLLAMTT